MPFSWLFNFILNFSFGQMLTYVFLWTHLKVIGKLTSENKLIYYESNLCYVSICFYYLGYGHKKIYFVTDTDDFKACNILDAEIIQIKIKVKFN